MIPNTTGAVLAFFLFVAPGLLFDLLSERRRAGIPETSFREASRVVLASTAFTTLALGLVAAPCLVVPQARRWIFEEIGLGIPAEPLFRSRRWIFEWLMGSAALNATQPLVLLMMFVVAAMACALAGAAHWRLSRSGIRLRQVSAWTHVFRAETPPGAAPYVRVKTNSGSTYTGFVGNYTPNLEVEGRELVLVPPLWSAAPGQSLAPVSTWSRIVLRGDEIAVLMLDYRPDPSEAGGATDE